MESSTWEMCSLCVRKWFAKVSDGTLTNGSTSTSSDNPSTGLGASAGDAGKGPNGAKKQ